jgi:hypothetical protein
MTGVTTIADIGRTLGTVETEIAIGTMIETGIETETVTVSNPSERMV